VGVSVQDQCCGCQCAGPVLWVSVCTTSIVGVSVQDKYVGAGVQDKCCGCQCTGQVCSCQFAGQVLWVSVCSPACLFVGRGGAGVCRTEKRVCHMHVLLLAGRCEPIWAHGALQDQVLNQQPSSCCYLFLVRMFFSLSFQGFQASTTLWQNDVSAVHNYVLTPAKFTGGF
jgi:hypothetical protein